MIKNIKYCDLKGCPNELTYCDVDRGSSLGHPLFCINFHIILKIKQKTFNKNEFQNKNEIYFLFLLKINIKPY